MKKVLLTFMAAMGLAATASAQLAEGSVFPDFTLTDISGNVHHLYADLNAGKTVFIDISATWCPPCWAYHNTHALDTLYAQHGPAGLAGVDGYTTNDVVVLFVQGEATSHLAELYGDYAAGAIPFTTTELPYATVTQGNWVAKTLYPIIDDTTSADPSVGTAALDAAWHITYFPTVYMICRDHLVHVMTQPTAAEAYAAVTAGPCPTTPPASGTSVDAKSVNYSGTGYFDCTGTPAVSFQNYSSSATITAATMNVMVGSTVVATQAWAGSLAPYDVANVSFTTGFPGGASFAGYSYTVSVAGDVNAANNAFTGPTFGVYAPANAQATPYSENFTASTLSDKYVFLEPNGLVFTAYDENNPASPGSALNITGSDGASPNTALVFDDYDLFNGYGKYNYTAQFMYGNYNTTGALYDLAFDLSYAATTGASSTDKMIVNVSTDCGSTWTAAWTGTGATIETAPSVGSNWFVPTAASQWKHFVVNLSAYKNNDLMIMLESETPASSGKGMSIYLDNLSFVAPQPAGVSQIALEESVSVFPNPAKDLAYVSLELPEAATIQVQLTDIVGHVINTISQDMTAGSQKIELSTSNLPTGLYNVKISVGTSTVTKQLSVVR